MKIVDDDTIALAPRPGNEETVSDIIVAGAPTKFSLRAATLEAAVDTGNEFLLFTTDDTPFEEILGVHLLARSGAPIETLWIGGPYATGAFSSLRICAPDAVSFRFIEDSNWIIRVLPVQGLRIPFLSDPRGVWRKFGIFRRLVVSRGD